MELEDSTDALRICSCTASIFGVGGDLLAPLEGTPSWTALRKVLDYNKKIRL